MAFNKKFSFAGKSVGEGCPVLFIAEAGVAHFGALDKAYELVDLAVESGADVFKTQAYQTRELVASNMTSWFSRLESKEVDLEFLKKVKNRCDERGIIFLCTPHEESVIPWMKALNVPAIKIGSGERGNDPYIKKLIALGLPLIVSTGMYEASHLHKLIALCESEGVTDLALLHCVTSYPTPKNEANLRVLNTYRNFFDGVVGYSDHTQGHDAVLAAVALGANIIEKHISIDFNVADAQDWKVSSGPDDLAELIRKVRAVEELLGCGDLKVASCERRSVDWAIKSLVTTKALKSGAKISEGDLIGRRSGAGGISPTYLHSILGKTILRDMVEGQKLSWDFFE